MTRANSSRRQGDFRCRRLSLKKSQPRRRCWVVMAPNPSTNGGVQGLVVVGMATSSRRRDVWHYLDDACRCPRMAFATTKMPWLRDSRVRYGGVENQGLKARKPTGYILVTLVPMYWEFAGADSGPSLVALSMGEGSLRKWSCAAMASPPRPRSIPEQIKRIGLLLRLLLFVRALPQRAPKASLMHRMHVS